MCIIIRYYDEKIMLLISAFVNFLSFSVSKQGIISMLSFEKERAFLVFENF